MMMSFCRKSVHSFLSFTTTTTDSLSTSIVSPKSSWKSHQINPPPPPDGFSNGLGLISAVSDSIMQKSPNVLESASLKPVSPRSSPPKKDPGGIGFIDYIGGGVDGLMSCTESLGFESSDERLVNDVDQMENTGEGMDYDGGRRMKARRSRVAVKKFPPPLSSLNHHGQPKFYLLPVRKDGRLELTEIRIERPEILRACREDGRLRLHFITDEQDNDDDDEEEEVAAIAEELEQEEEEEVEEPVDFVKEKEEKRANIPVTGEGFRRCIEVINHHHRRDLRRRRHHHHLDVWRQQCVTIS